MVSALDSRASTPGSNPGQGHCVVFLGKTLYSYGASLHPGQNNHSNWFPTSYTLGESNP